MDTPEGLPAAFSTTQMRFLTGLSVARLDQLAQSGVIDRPAKGVYAADSVVRYIRFLRRSGDGPKDWQSARTVIAQERAALLRLERLQREGNLLEKNAVKNLGVEIVTTFKTKMLCVPSAVAPRLVGLKTAAEGEAVVRGPIEDALRELAALGEIHQETAARGRRNGSGAKSL
jgi:hypothetical protein